MSAGVLENEGRAKGTRLPEVTDNLICKRSFGGFGASSHVKMVPILNDIDINLEGINCEDSIYIQRVTWALPRFFQQRRKNSPDTVWGICQS
jgi:hypothetical protein